MVPNVKKGIVILLVIAALVVLITPGIIGRLAEESFDQNLEMAVTESEDVVVSSLGFVRGWFTSEGQHRIELRDVKDPRPVGGAVDSDMRFVDALIVTTRIDHGLIPVTSMARDEGSLAPGLGSAVSTLSAEVSNGTSFDLPGVIYSEVGLTGELQSNFVLDADSTTVEGRQLQWGDADLLVTSNAATGYIATEGVVGALSMVAPQETIRVGEITVAGEQRPGDFGYPLGFVDVTVDSFAVESAYNDFFMGPMRVQSSLTAENDRVNGDALFEVANFNSPIGDAEVTWHARIQGADGNALGQLLKSYQGMDDPDLAWAALKESDAAVEALLASGMELHFDRFDLVVPQGTMTSEMHLTVHASRPDQMSWAAIILALDGTLEVGISQGLVDWLTAQFPEFGGAVALGYLRKSGDLYETLVEIRSGVLTINGAPMQIPLGAFQ